MHSKNDIDLFFKKAFFAVLTYPSSEGLLSQLMIFSHTVDGGFFLASQNDKELFNSLTEKTDVSVLIYKEEEALDNIRQVNIIGQATLIENFDSDEAKLGYETIGEKSPLIGSIPLNEELQQYYSLIKVEAKTISYITFAEIKQHLSPTVLKRI